MLKQVDYYLTGSCILKTSAPINPSNEHPLKQLPHKHVIGQLHNQQLQQYQVFHFHQNQIFQNRTRLLSLSEHAKPVQPLSVHLHVYPKL